MFLFFVQSLGFRRSFGSGFELLGLRWGRGLRSLKAEVVQWYRCFMFSWFWFPQILLIIPKVYAFPVGY